MRCQPVENVGGHGITAQQTGRKDNDCNRHRVERHDEKAVQRCTHPPAGRTAIAFQKIGYRHRNHRENARGQHGGEAPQNGLDDERPKRSALGRLARGCGFQYDGQLRIFGRHASVIVANHPLHLGPNLSLRHGQCHCLSESRRTRESTDFHVEHRLVSAFRHGELLHGTVVSHPINRQKPNNRGIGASVLVGSHVVHMIRFRNGSVEHDPITVAAQRLDRGAPSDLLRRCTGNRNPNGAENAQKAKYLTHKIEI